MDAKNRNEFNRIRDTVDSDQEFVEVLMDEAYDKIVNAGNSLNQKDGASEDQFNLFRRIISSLIDYFPSVKVNGPEAPLYLGPVKLYYKVAAEAGKGNNTVSFDMVAEEQRIKLKNPGFGSKVGTDASIDGSVDSEGSTIGISGKNGSFELDSKGMESGKIIFKDNNDTYSFEIKKGTDGIAAEFSLETETENGSVTSIVGVKKSRTNADQTVRVTAPETESYQMPVINQEEYKDAEVVVTDTGVDWAKIGGYVLGTIMVAYGIYCLVQTGDITVIEQGIAKFS